MATLSIPTHDSPVRIRDWRADDLVSLARWWEPGHEWQRWDGPSLPYPGQEQRAKRIATLERELIEQAQSDPRRSLCIEAEGEFVGRVNRYWIDEPAGWLAVGIDLYAPSNWGRGIGTRALTLWFDYLASSSLDWARVDLRTWSGNERMIALARRLGFREEARFREARVVDGRRFDVVSFGLLRREWASRA